METLWVLTIALFTLSLEISSAKGGCRDEKMDIAIMGDRSRSMNKWQRASLIKLVFNLIDKEGVSFSGNHFAIGTFGPGATIHNNFKDKFYYNNKNLKKSIQKKFSYEPKYLGTRTDLAMDRAVNGLFTPQGGDRPNVKNILFIFTDGKPFIARNDEKPLIPFWKSRLALERKNVKIIVIGVGQNLWNEKEKMRMIAGKKGTVLLYRDFTKFSQSLDEIFEAMCAIDGGYTDWSESKCSVTCGGGVKTLTRTCTSPPPSKGGNDCNVLGPAEKKVSCNEQKCPIDGGYTDWSESNCSATCGGGTKTLRRTCTNPPPSNGGKDCSELGPAERRVSCNEVECPIDGGYTEWSESECSVPCGGGTQLLTRTCTNPPPAYGGKDCSELGPDKKKVSCNEGKCPIDGGYSQWSESECSVTCGGGTKILTRTCTNPPPAYGGKDCSELGPVRKTVSCNKADCRGCPLANIVSDIAILGDRSRSMNKEFRKVVIKLITDLVDKTGVSSSGNHFAIGTFGPSATIHNNFKNQVYHNGEKLKDHIQRKLSYIPAKWGTRIDLALDRAVKDLFSPRGGDRPEARNIMFIFTDGKNFIEKNDKRPLIPFTQSLQALKVKNVSIVVVGVGKEINKAKTQFLAIASKNGKVLLYDNLQKLSNGLDEILEAACE